MNEKIIYIGLDVDDQSFHGAALTAATGEVIEFKCRPNTKGNCNQLRNLKEKFHALTSTRIRGCKFKVRSNSQKDPRKKSCLTSGPSIRSSIKALFT